MTNHPTFHAIYTVAGDVEMLGPSVASIYEHVSGITVVTGFDRDWMGRSRDAGGLVSDILSRRIDPERKISLVVVDETNEARTRNRAMDFVAPRRSSMKVQLQSEHDRPMVTPDYFLIVDADEIYEGSALESIRAYVGQTRQAAYRVPCVRYFRHWNFRITGHEWMLSIVRSDLRLRYLRLRPVRLPRRVLARIPGIPAVLRAWLLGYQDIPVGVGVFHHGSYVGPRSRIEEKLASFGHSSDVDPDWIDNVWERFTTETRDLNPVYPSVFPSVERIKVDDLPPEIRRHDWPPEYLER